jgi:ankyrin repeat protein
MPSRIISSCKEDDPILLKKALKGRSVNNVDRWGRYPIYYAIKHDAPECISLLLTEGADVILFNRVGGKKIDSLTLAIKKGLLSDFDIASSLLQTVINRIDKEEYLSYILRGSLESFKHFISVFKIISFKGLEHLFCRYARKDHYQYCLENDICFDLQESLKYVVLYRKYGVFLYLLSRVTYTEQLNYYYQGDSLRKKSTLLSMCASQGYLRGVKTLIKKGADYNQLVVNEKGESLDLLMAFVDNNILSRESEQRQRLLLETLEYLAMVFDINKQNSLGITALMIACRTGCREYVQRLLELGADVRLVDINDKSARDYCRNTSIRSLLIIH